MYNKNPTCNCVSLYVIFCIWNSIAFLISIPRNYQWIQHGFMLTALQSSACFTYRPELPVHSFLHTSLLKPCPCKIECFLHFNSIFVEQIRLTCPCSKYLKHVPKQANYNRTHPHYTSLIPCRKVDIVKTITLPVWFMCWLFCPAWSLLEYKMHLILKYLEKKLLTVNLLDQKN